MAYVEVRDGESIEQALKRFRVKVRREGLMEQMSDQMSYKKPSKRRRDKQDLARRRAKKEQKERTRAPVESVPYGR